MEDQTNAMETQPNHFGNGIAGTLLSVISSMLAWISLQNFQTFMAIAASTVAVVSGCLAGYNWWLTIKEKRLKINNHKNHKSS